MSARLHQLRRQKEILQEHLAWLDGEIARESGVESVVPAATAPPVPPLAPPSPPATDAAADELLARYRAEEALNPKAARRGCLLAFSLGLGLLIAIVVTIYFVRYRTP